MAARSPLSLVHAMIEELAKVKATVTAQGEDTASYDRAAGIFEDERDPGLSRVPDPAAVRGNGRSPRLIGQD